MEKLVITVPELAEMLSLSKATIYTMVRENKIPHKKLGKKIVFYPATIEKWLSITNN